MRKLRLRVWTAGLIPAVAAVTLIGAGIAYAFDSGDKPEGTGADTITWTGQGADGGELNTVECGVENPAELPPDIDVNEPYLLWVLTPDGGSLTNDAVTPVLHLGGTGSGDYNTNNPGGSPAKFVTPYFTPAGLTASADIVINATGNGAWNLVISHGCPGTTPDPASLHIRKFYDANANGVFDGADAYITGWHVSYNLIPGLTPVDVDPIAPGDYTVAEGTPVETNWMHTTATSFDVTINAGDDVTVEFGNLCLGAGGGLTLGFWSNKNGQALFGADDLALLVSLNLRNANGSAFNPGNYAAFRTWLLNATATNMAYMLSAQLAAMELNVFNGKVSAGALIYAPGTTSANLLGFATVGAVMAEADAELALHGLTLSGSPFRSYQEALKNALDKANNNLNFVQATACPFSFAA
jgi:hypothetical protein